MRGQHNYEDIAWNWQSTIYQNNMAVKLPWIVLKQQSAMAYTHSILDFGVYLPIMRDVTNMQIFVITISYFRLV
jgi:hypothetical protein